MLTFRASIVKLLNFRCYLNYTVLYKKHCFYFYFQLRWSDIGLWVIIDIEVNTYIEGQKRGDLFCYQRFVFHKQVKNDVN